MNIISKSPASGPLDQAFIKNDLRPVPNCAKRKKKDMIRDIPELIVKWSVMTHLVNYN